MTILVLDDDSDFRTALAENLREDGHRVVELDTPAHAPALAELRDVGVVVADYHLPYQNGLAFVDAFHAVHPRVPVIVVTADPSVFIDDAVRKRPFARLQRKPVDFHELEAMIEGMDTRRNGYRPRHA
jgi:DNA-binding NtrC family response regulator